MKKCNLNFSLPVSFLREGESFIAYTPALDLATAGKTFEEAKLHFEEAVNLFFEEIIKEETLDDVLTDLGWQKINKTYFPPIAISHQIEDFCIQTPLN